MQRLGGMDAQFIYMETPTAHFHVVGTMIIDPTGVPDFGAEKLKRVLLERIHLLPPFRRRLVTVPLNVAAPMWIEDGSFDIDNHVKRIGVPSPGTMHELAEVVGDIAGRKLDMTRPLWEMWVAEGLEDGRVAIVSKMHHCAIDGVSGADLMVHLFDLSPEVVAPPPPDEPWEPENEPTQAELIGQALTAAANRPGELLRVGRTLVNAVVNLVDLARTERDEDDPGPTLPFTAPRTPFNGALTQHRSVAYGGSKLDDLKLIRKAFDCKINDVVLAATTGTLRNWLADHGGVPDRPLVASCPVSVKTEEQKGEIGNHVSSMFVSLPVDVDDPVERLLLIRENTQGAKEVHGALGADTIMSLSNIAPPSLANLGFRLYSSTKLADRHRPVHNVVISNVPGPPIPLYCAGARVVATYPMGPPMEGATLNLTVLSNMGNLDLGIIACASVPDLWQMADGFEDEIAALLKAAKAALSARGETVPTDLPPTAAELAAAAAPPPRAAGAPPKPNAPKVAPPKTAPKAKPASKTTAGAATQAAAATSGAAASAKRAAGKAAASPQAKSAVRAVKAVAETDPLEVAAEAAQKLAASKPGKAATDALRKASQTPQAKAAGKAATDATAAATISARKAAGAAGKLAGAAGRAAGSAAKAASPATRAAKKAKATAQVTTARETPKRAQ